MWTLTPELTPELSSTGLLCLALYRLLGLLLNTWWTQTPAVRPTPELSMGL